MGIRQFWRDYSLVMRSKQRKIVIRVMNTPRTVTEIKKRINLGLSETSRVLRTFKDQGLAECLNPKDTLGRVYQLTKRGKLVKEKIEN
ncbi:MAG: ArsR family transcriptional regulator [Nanoarchaeota archaeon]|nr:ArsR family transcriptional regulator [Nanoarchaeota archaeon]